MNDKLFGFDPFRPPVFTKTEPTKIIEVQITEVSRFQLEDEDTIPNAPEGYFNKFDIEYADVGPDKYWVIVYRKGAVVVNENYDEELAEYHHFRFLHETQLAKWNELKAIYDQREEIAILKVLKEKYPNE